MYGKKMHEKRRHLTQRKHKTYRELRREKKNTTTVRSEFKHIFTQYENASTESSCKRNIWNLAQKNNRGTLLK